MHLQTDKTSLDSTKTTFFRGIFAYFFPQKLFSTSFLIGLCSSCLLFSTGFGCSRKNRNAPKLEKVFPKSNTSNHFSDPLPLRLRREVDPLWAPLLPSQSVKRLHVKDALTKQEPSGTKPTSIALAQPNLLENRLQKAPLPSKDSSTSLPVPPLSLEQKDNLIVLLALEETLSSPETGVVAKDDIRTIKPENTNLLSQIKPGGTCPNITSQALDVYNISYTDIALHEDISKIVKYIENFISNQKVIEKMEENILAPLLHRQKIDIIPISKNSLQKEFLSKLSTLTLKEIKALKSALKLERSYQKGNADKPNHDLTTLTKQSY